MNRYKSLIVSIVLASFLLAACGGGAATSPTAPSVTEAPTAMPTEAPTAAPTAMYTEAPTSAPSGGEVPNLMDNGFPTVLTQQEITPGTATTIQTGPYTIQVPADAFNMPVTFTVLSADPANFSGKVPAGETPILAFAFMVKDAQGNLVAKFNNPVMFTAKDPKIVSGSMYYNVTPSGEISPNPTGLEVKDGELSHPVAGAPVGWLITAPSTALRTPEQAALDAVGGQKIGGTVTVLASWGDGEQDAFMAMIKPFEDATGVKIEYTGTRDLNAILTTRVQGGNPPDLAGLPGPGQMAQFAQQGDLVDLSNILDMSTYNQQYAKTWSDLGTTNGKLVAVFIKSSVKGLIWYDPKVWQANNYQIPATWDDMMNLSTQISDSGQTPWCVALESGATSGWPGTDWLEDIVLRQSGEKTYNDWWQGNIAWTSPEIKQAWETWGQIVANPKMVYGGANTMLTTNFGNVGDGLFKTPPNCYMVHQASFITSFFQQNTPGIQPVTDFDFFGFPPFKSGAPVSTEMAGDLFGMFNDTPQAEALIKYLVTPEAQDIWVKIGGAISPNKAVPLDTYPDALSKKAAERLTSADVAVFDASDMMPDAMTTAFYQAVLNYIQNPQNLDSILQNLDTVQQSAYNK